MEKDFTYTVESILKKLAKKSKRKIKNLVDFMPLSFAELQQQTKNSLSRGEICYLYEAAQQGRKDSRLLESRLLAHANPQLARIAHLGVKALAQTRRYDEWFGGRSSRFVKPGSVASMFSPAAYLTELYRESKDLHADNSLYHLDRRRPDLAALALTQANMDAEISTLTLSNELLLNKLQTLEEKDEAGVMELLSTYRQTGLTPYHLPYEAVRQSILLQDKAFSAFTQNPDVAKRMDPISLLAIYADISPELYQILLEDISENAAELIKKNFGEINVEAFCTYSNLARYYDLTPDELSSQISLWSPTGKTNQQQYQNSQLITLEKSDRGILKELLIKRTPKEGYNSLNYAELIPLEGEHYLYNFSVKTTEYNYPDFRLQNAKAEYVYRDTNFVPLANTHYSIPIKLPIGQITKGLDLRLFRVKPDPWSTKDTHAFFQRSELSLDTFLLTFNKLIRLYKATGIDCADIWQVIRSVHQNDFTIDSAVLEQLFYVKYYMQHYAISVNDALVLSHADITQHSVGQQASQFTQLFNTPYLDGQEFFADDTQLDLTPGVSEDYFRLGVLKRAFQVNETDLYTLWKLASGGKSPAFSCSIKNLSMLYRLRLLAELHHLTVHELSLLLSISAYAEQNLADFSDAEWASLVDFVYSCTEWLATQRWSVSEVYLMLTDHYSTTLTPDIENLLMTLRNGVSDTSLSGEELMSVAAPFIAAAIQLDSAETALAILMWINQLQPRGLSFADFMQWVRQETPTADEDKVAFCQVLGQLSLIVRHTGLSASELSLLVTQPERFQKGESLLPQDLMTLQSLTDFHTWIMQCGNYASEVLTTFSLGTLTVEQLATALGEDAQEVAQALQQVNANATVFSDWKTVDVALQWLHAAATLGITPEGVAALIKLKYLAEANAATPSFSDWRAASALLQSGLNSQQTADLQAFLDESSSAAFSAYYIKTAAPSQVSSRDELYSYLLIDNQISAQVKTTRLAEAIASIQLYINRALSGVETGVSERIRTRQFFTDWEMYNKRYSTWAGVSLLVYYPENYVDPTLRLGQTKMLDDLLQQISQSQLSTDTVEEGFRNYLAAFEDIANLNVTSGYHDNVDVDEGFTYFIGYSQTEPRRYYWRKLDHSKGHDGKFAANAWGEWTEIVCAMVPYQGFIRPVLYKSRLYVVWVEQELRKNEEASTDIVYYHFKLSHLRYDGSWASPFTFDVTDYVKAVSDTTTLNTATGLFCAEYSSENTLIIYFYKKQNTYPNTNVKASGFYLFSDMTIKEITSARLKNLIKLSENQLDTFLLHKINNPLSEIKKAEIMDSEVIKSELVTLETTIENYNYSITSLGALDLDLIPVFTVKYEGISSERERFLLHTGMTKGLKVIKGFIFEQVPQFYNDNIIDVYCIGIKTSTINGELGFVVEIDLHEPLKGASSGLIRIRSLAVEFEGQDLIQQFLMPILPFNEKMTIYQSIFGLSEEEYDFRLLKKLYIYYLYTEKTKIEEELSWEGLENLELLATINIKNAHNYQEFIDIQPEDVVFSIPSPDEAKILINASEGCSKGPVVSDNKEIYRFDKIYRTLSSSWIAATTSLDIACSFQIKKGSELIAENQSIMTVIKNQGGLAVTLNTNENRAQYMQIGPYRTRLNTIFATQLIERASLGIDAVLSMDTQNLPEPQLGKGFYALFIVPAYDKNKHGTARWFNLNLKHVFDNNAHIYYSGTLQDKALRVILFIPLDEKPLSKDYIAKIFLSTQKQKDGTWLGAHFILNQNGEVAIHPSSNLSSFDAVHVLNDQNTEPMDFSGANALYFWEMFYYVPMLVFQRLLQEQNFTEATRWLRYIWNPAGYLVRGEWQDYYWNVRPLEESTSWNANPLDSVDPDAVAQNDPMHYKVATFMRALDLLMARGDAAYRQLERDTLNEAKMWYMQALTLLGDESYIAQDTSWSEPRLDEAASLTTQSTYQRILFQLYQQVELAEPRTANSLTALFLPQLNEKLQSYWQTLSQRLYNLRHNLSIDGQPLLLPLYATPANPSALLSAAVQASQGGANLPPAVMPMYRFAVILENTKAAVTQLMQFGNILLSITERQDAEALTELLQTQGSELALQSIQIQDQTISEIQANEAVLQEGLQSAQSRFNSFKELYDEDVNRGEKQAMDLYLSSSVISTSSKALYMAAAAADLVPNIYGLAVGGSRFGALFNATGIGVEIGSSATRLAADKISQSEAYRRRRQDWETQRNNAEFEIKQLDAQLETLSIRREAAQLQKVYLETQQAQTQAQLTILQSKFANKALYNWLRGRLAAIYYQFYDLTVSRCLMAEQAYQYELNDNASRFIKPGAWQGTYAGLLAGETLMLNLVQMEKSYLEKDERALEVIRTVSLAEVYAGLGEADKFIFSDQVQALLEAGSGSAGTEGNGLRIQEEQLLASVQLEDLKIQDDYPVGLGAVRRIKQISVTLPALAGPYQDVQAVLSYGGSVEMPRGCKAVAVSHGINDSGQFMLDFNDAKYLPFEGIPVNDRSGLSLSFPHALDKQAELLKSLNDIILHIRYTIRH